MKTEDAIYAFLNVCLYDACSFILTNHTTIKLQGLVKKNNQEIPTYLINN